MLASARHEAGELDQAESALYARRWRKSPEHAEALHLLGLIAFQRGEFPSAIELIGRALPELDDLPEAHLNLGNALREVGGWSKQWTAIGGRSTLDPAYGMAHSNLARTLNDQGLFEVGLESARRAVAADPGLPRGTCQLCRRAGRASGALGRPRSPCDRRLSWRQIRRRSSATAPVTAS